MHPQTCWRSKLNSICTIDSTRPRCHAVSSHHAMHDSAALLAQAQSDQYNIINQWNQTHVFLTYNNGRLPVSIRTALYIVTAILSQLLTCFTSVLQWVMHNFYRIQCGNSLKLKPGAVTLAITQMNSHMEYMPTIQETHTRKRLLSQCSGATPSIYIHND